MSGKQYVHIGPLSDRFFEINLTNRKSMRELKADKKTGLKNAALRSINKYLTKFATNCHSLGEAIFQ